MPLGFSPQLFPVSEVAYAPWVGSLHVLEVTVCAGPAPPADVSVLASAAAFKGLSDAELPKELRGVLDVPQPILPYVPKLDRHEHAGCYIAVWLEPAVEPPSTASAQEIGEALCLAPQRPHRLLAREVSRNYASIDMFATCEFQRNRRVLGGGGITKQLTAHHPDVCTDPITASALSGAFSPTLDADSPLPPTENFFFALWVAFLINSPVRQHRKIVRNGTYKYAHRYSNCRSRYRQSR